MKSYLILCLFWAQKHLLVPCGGFPGWRRDANQSMAGQELPAVCRLDWGTIAGWHLFFLISVTDMLLLLLSFINRGLIDIPLNLKWKGSSLIPSLNPAFEFCKVTFNVSKRYCIPGKICNKAMRWADGALKQPAAKLLGKNLTWHIILEAAKLVCSSTEEKRLNSPSTALPAP